MEATVFTAEIKAIKAALSYIETSNELRWKIFSDSQASIQPLTKQNLKFPLTKRLTSVKFPVILV